MTHEPQYSPDANEIRHRLQRKLLGENYKSDVHIYFLDIPASQYVYSDDNAAMLQQKAHRTLKHLIPLDTDPRATDFYQIFNPHILHIWLAQDVTDWLSERDYPYAFAVVQVCNDGVHEKEFLKITIKGLTPATDFKLTYQDRIRQEQHDV